MPLSDRLRDQQMVKGIPVVHRQAGVRDQMRRGDRQQGKALGLKLGQDLLNVGQQLADAGLYENLPQRHRGDQDVARWIGDTLSCRITDRGIVGQPLEQGIGIE